MLTEFFLQLGLSKLLFIAITGLSVYWLWSKTRRPYLQHNVPPFPVSPLPIVGHFFMLGSNMRESIKEWRRKAGDIFSLDIGGQLNVVVSGYDNLKEVLVKNADNVINTQKLFYQDFVNEYDRGIIGARDDNWKEQRTVSLAILRDFGMGKNILAEKIQEEVAVYIDKLAALKGRPYDFKLLTNVSVSNLICAILIGKRFEHDDPKFVSLLNQLNDSAKYFNGLVFLTAFPSLYYLPGDFFHIKKFMTCVNDTNETFAKYYANKFKDAYNEGDEPTNFIIAYFQEMNKRKRTGKPTHLDEENLWVVIRTFFGAGTETTSTTITWCVLYMLHYPKIQEKVYQELEEHVGPARVPNISDKPKLKYLNAVIMETQRIASVIPISFRREVSSSFELGGYTIPKGSIVWPNLDSALHDKKIWGDPENFRPERFLDSKGDLLNPEELIPFSTGRRGCLGQGMAKMELFVFLSNMFHRFKFEIADPAGNPPSTEAVLGLTAMPKNYEVRFTERRKD